MRARSFLWLVIIQWLVITTTKAQLDSNWLYPVPVGNHWGYINCSGEVVIEPTYDYARDFMSRNNSAIVSKNGLYGSIDLKGEEELPIIYKALRLGYPTKHNNAYVYCAWNGEFYGIVNAKNDVLVAFEYDQVKPLTTSVVAVKKDKKWGLVNLKNEALTPIIYNKIRTHKRGGTMIVARAAARKWAVFSSEGKEICPPMFDYYSVQCSDYYINGMVDRTPVTIDYTGTIQPQLTMKVSRFNARKYSVARDTNKLYGIINEKFEWIIPPRYKALDFYTYGSNSQLVFFLKGEQWGVMNLQEEVLLEPKHPFIEYVNESIVAISDDWKWFHLWNLREKKWVTTQRYGGCYGGDLEGRFISVKEGLHEDDSKYLGVLNAKGETVVPFEYTELFVWYPFVNVMQNHEKSFQGIFSLTSKKLIIPPIFDSVEFYDLTQLCKVSYGVRHRNKIAYFTPDGELVWASYGFDVQALIDNYYQKDN